MGIHLRATYTCVMYAITQRIIFFHPDYTVGPGISPDHALRLAGCTAGRDLHPALKILYSLFMAFIIVPFSPVVKYFIQKFSIRR